jgi:PD-(D/E)XK nuclease superfamily
MDEPSPQTESTASKRRVLEELVVDNQDLETLEDLLEPFNLFEAIGAVSQELRHSDFLAFMLDPGQSHGLGELFTTRFLQQVLLTPGASSEVSPIDIDVWDLSAAEVRREWQNIDILLLSHEHRLAVIVENKINSSEHGDQLERYWRTVEEQFTGWKIVGCFLTLSKEEPSDGRYAALGYDTICRLLESIIEFRSTSIGPDARVVMAHYVQMLRRHFWEDTEISELARRIYQKHKKALDLVFDFRPDRQAEIGEILADLVRNEPIVVLEDANKTSLHFLPHHWIESNLLNMGAGWTKTGRMLLFEINNEPSRVVLSLGIGPGTDETRKRLFEAALSKRPPFKPSQTILARMWNRIYQETLISGPALTEQDIGGVRTQLEAAWTRFVREQLPVLSRSIDEEAWLWSDEAPSQPENQK